MKRLYFVLLFLFATVLISFAQDNGILRKNLVKGAAPNTGPVPDYSEQYFWAASPYKHSPADSLPASLKYEKRDTLADVFFIHPTSYIGDNDETSIFSDNAAELIRFVKGLRELSWNADLSDESLNDRTDSRSIMNQASAFNGSCRIFAPRYRQANIKAFFVPDSKEAKDAFDLAYSDIKKAFEYYLEHENNNRPIIIASHSQGSLHAIRLLSEFFDGKPLQKRLVCAYIIGYQIPLDAFKNIPIGKTPDATGCFVGWRTFKDGEITDAISKENGNSQCVNPLKWTIDSKWADKSLNHGALFGFKDVIPDFTGAEIEPDSKILWVKLPEISEKKLNRIKNYHTLDYNLFWMNIRENVKVRINGYLKK